MKQKATGNQGYDRIGESVCGAFFPDRVIVKKSLTDVYALLNRSYLYNPYYFMYATLISPTTDEELHLLRDGKTRATTGSNVSSLYRLKDTLNKEGAFFVFPDLSIRMEGAYRLKVCYLIALAFGYLLNISKSLVLPL
jgi:hypothetical protein